MESSSASPYSVPAPPPSLPSSSSSSSSASASSAPSSALLQLTRDDFIALSRQLSHMSAEILARRFQANRIVDFKVSELKEILRYLREHKYHENPFWGNKAAGTKKDSLVQAVKNGLDWMKKNAAAIVAQQQQQSAADRATAMHQQQHQPQHQQQHHHQQQQQQQQSSSPSSGQQHQQQQQQRGGSYVPSGGERTVYSSLGSASGFAAAAPPLPYGFVSVNQQNGFSASGYNPPAYLNYAAAGQPSLPPSSAYRKDNNGYASYQQSQSSSSSSSSSSVYLNGAYRHSSSSSSSSSSVSADAQLSSLLHHPAFLSGRSPYDALLQTLSAAFLAPQPAQASSSRAFCQFVVPQHVLVRLRRSKQPPASADDKERYAVCLRLFSTSSLTAVQWDKSFQVKVNAHVLPMPEARKLNKTKKRGIELVRTLNISDWLQANNYVEVESYRSSYVSDMFRGLVVAELIQERDTADIVASIVKRQPKQQSETTVKTEPAASSSSSTVPLSTFRPNPKQCSVCFSTKDLLRCSRCKNEWYCLSAGTRVSLAAQTSITIESVSATQATSVLSYDPAQNGCVNKLTLAPHLLAQGVQDCVELVLEDGRSLVCTPDHRVMTVRGEVQVDQLAPTDRVLMAPEGPLVNQQPEDWTLTYTLTERDKPDVVVRSRTTDPAGYQRCMAFARLLGYVITDGTIKTDADGVTISDGTLFMGHALDADSISQDIALVLGVPLSAIAVSPPNTHDSTYRVYLPRRLTRALNQFGCPAGKKLGQGVDMPPILLQTDTPIDFIREFLGAMFGGDGSPPMVSNKQTTSSTWSPVVFYVSVTAAQRVEAWQMFEGELLALLGLFGITGTISERPCRSGISTAGSWQVRLHVEAACTVLFADGIGFRHCIHKQQRLSVAACYYRGVACRLEQKQRLVDATIASRRGTGTWGQAAAAAAAQMATREVMLSNVVEPTVRNMSRYAAGHRIGNKGRPIYKLIPTFVSDCGGAVFFNPDHLVTGSSSHVYAVPRHLTVIPTFHLGVEGVRPVGQRATYDLSVADTHLCVANGIVVHNCGEEHQREHWATHRQVCQPPTAEQEREREAFEKHRDAASNHSNTAAPAPVAAAPAVPGQTRLRMPARRVKREGAAAASSAGDSDVELVDDDIAEVDTIVSLKDSISQERIELAAKGRACSHLPCFDVSTFLQLSQQSGVWQCPICYVGVTWEDVVIDAEMNAVLREVDPEVSQIRVKPDGSYEPIDSEPSRKRQKTAAADGVRSSTAAASSSSARYGQPAAPVSPLSVSSPVSSSSSPSTREFPPAATNGHAVRLSSSSPPVPSPAPVLPVAGSSSSSSSSRPPSVFDAERADYLNVDVARFGAATAASSSSSALQPADDDRGGGYYDDRTAPDDFLLRPYTPLFDVPQSPNTYLASSPVPMQATQAAQAGQPPPPAAAPPAAARGSTLLSSASSAAAEGAASRFDVGAGQTLEDAIVIDDD